MAATRQCDLEQWAQKTPPTSYTIRQLLIDFPVSRRKLFRVFHDCLGMPPRKWIKVRRMKLAPDMLRKEDSVKSASIALGYKDPAHFTHDFKRAFGLCPTAFRASIHGETPVQLWLPFDPEPSVGTLRQQSGTDRQHSALPLSQPQF
jgi:AraC-like DNA-binding protein